MRTYVEIFDGLDELYEIGERTLGLGKNTTHAAGEIAESKSR